MKKNGTKIIWGILLLIAAVGLIFYAFMPGLAVFTVPVWKWFIAAALIYWIIRKLGFGKSLADRLSIFVPLALLFFVFEREIGGALGKGSDFVNNWIIIIAAVLIDVAIYVLFKHTWKVNKKFATGSSTYTVDGVETRNSVEGQDPENAKEGRSFRLGDHTCYIDAYTTPVANVENQLGELNVYYQNTDVGDLSTPLTLNVANQLGQTVVHVPRNWHVELNTGNSLGSVNCRPDGEITIRTITINVDNKLGETSVVSPD